MNAAVRRLRGISATGTLRAAVYAVAATVFWWTLSVPVGVAAATASALCAALVADRLARSTPPLRGATALGLALGVALLGAAIVHGMLEWELASRWIGSIAAVHLAEAVRCACFTAPAVFALRFCAARYPAAVIFEVFVAAAAFVAAVAAHREGMIHRPLPLGDFAWARGIDPTLLLLGVGVASAVLLAVLLLREERRARIALHLGALAALVLLLVLSVRLSGLPVPQPPADLGLTGTGDEESEGSSSRATQPRNDFDFKSDYSNELGKVPVAVVVLHDEYAPESGLYYFRESAFSRFNGRRLVTATRDDVDRDIVASFPSAPRALDWQPPAASERHSVRTTTGVLVDHVHPFAIDTPVWMAPVGRDDPRFRRVYDSVSLVRDGELGALFGGSGGDSNWSVEQFDYYTRTPDDPRYRELAEKLLDGLKPEYRDDPFARALAVKYYLDKNGIYSRRSQHADADDPVASFLFGDLTGYCVHFAHAAVYLMRSLGVPSRVATGYAVPADERGGGSSIMIRGLNAHAWPEIYLEGAGWVVVDVAPETVLDEFEAAPDGRLQMMLGQMLRNGIREPEDAQPEPLLDLRALARGLAMAAALALLCGFAVKAYRRAVPRFASERQLARVAYRAALDRLVAVGVRRRYGEGRERFATRAAALAPSIDPLTRAHLAAAWGGKRMRDRAGTTRRLALLAGELRRSTPLWRRWLGELNPYSWLWVR